MWKRKGKRSMTPQHHTPTKVKPTTTQKQETHQDPESFPGINQKSTQLTNTKIEHPALREEMTDFRRRVANKHDRMILTASEIPASTSTTTSIQEDVVTHRTSRPDGSMATATKDTVKTHEFDDDVMASQCVIFFVAGFETSSTAMSFCLYELAKNPEVQDKLRQEIDIIIEHHDGIMTYDALHDMKYLDRVIDETLRKHPPASSVGRKCTKRYVIPGTETVVEEGTDVEVPIYGLHHDPKYFPDPEKFDPDRFTPENKNKRPQLCYLPFGDGPRICIGKLNVDHL
ncbi:hypothetical protein PR048_012282 [Dryococelus australis]|uniref:Cytochrome P450 n=1 Tax=Dryococelus australis TaxID=614101 RepID=A0ABQ9HP33_9NEOP|nr:hypothetical protein PR048_012282 [Dryococelus australis]